MKVNGYTIKKRKTVIVHPRCLALQYVEDWPVAQPDGLIIAEFKTMEQAVEYAEKEK